MKKLITTAITGLLLAAGGAFAQGGTVDTSVEGIFNALSNTQNLQASVDTLLANGAKQQEIISVAAAAGIPLDKLKDLDVCVNASTADAKTLSATCMRQRSVVTAYNAGLNDPMKYLPATAAGKRAANTENK